MKRLAIAVLFVLGCGGQIPDWQKPCGGHVTAALSSVTLANDCGSKQSGAFSDAAPCAPGVACESGCRQSSMQLQFESTALTDSRIEIRQVRVIDPATGKVLETLTHRDPRKWNTESYVTWDEVLGKQSTVRAMYKLSAPTKASHATGVAADSRFAGSSNYTIEVDVAVDGVVRTLSIVASREPDFVT